MTVSNRLAFFLVLSTGFLGPVLVAGCAASTSPDASSEDDLTAATSTFTSLESKDCTTIPHAPQPEMEFSEQICAGVGGFELFVEDADARMNVQVKRGAAQFDLAVWSRLSGFSHLGAKAEWRAAAAGADPYALIFRYFQPDGSKGDGEKSFLVVAHVQKDAACIVDVVDASQANANAKAQQVADASRTKACPGGKPTNPASVFTKLDAASCKLISSEKEGGSSHSECPGVAGYKLFLDEGDLRQSVTVVAPGNKEHELFPVGGPLGGAFNRVGETADWRVNGPEKKPHALVFRFLESTGDGKTEHPYLMVAKIDAGKSCLVDIIDAKKHADANVLARSAADKAFGGSCPAKTPSPR